MNNSETPSFLTVYDLTEYILSQNLNLCLPGSLLERGDLKNYILFIVHWKRGLYYCSIAIVSGISFFQIVSSATRADSIYFFFSQFFTKISMTNYEKICVFRTYWKIFTIWSDFGRSQAAFIFVLRDSRYFCNSD
jgi:hypothetical protein